MKAACSACAQHSCLLFGVFSQEQVSHSAPMIFGSPVRVCAPRIKAGDKHVHPPL